MRAVQTINGSLEDSGPLYQLSVAQYHELIEADILGTDDRVELLEGVLFTKMPKDPLHAVVTALVCRLLGGMCGSEWFVRNQEPITTDTSEPEPDVAIVRGKLFDYTKRHPGPDELTLVVEVANTSLNRDRQLKLRLYARAGCPTYWIVNTRDRLLEVYAEPKSDSRGGYNYHSVQTLRTDERVTVQFDDMVVGTIEVADLFPPLSTED